MDEDDRSARKVPLLPVLNQIEGRHERIEEAVDRLKYLSLPRGQAQIATRTI